MMNKREFYDYVKDNVKEYLPESYANSKITLQETIKDNDQKLTGICIPEGDSNIVPNIYLDDLYQKYLDGKNLDSCVGDVADRRIEYHEPGFDWDVNMLLDYSSIKDKLQMRICDPDLNRERLEGKAVTRHGDFAAYYTVNLSEGKEGTASIPVTESLRESWGVDTEQLRQDAMRADQHRGPAMMSMDDLMAEMVFGSQSAENLLEGEKNIRDYDSPLFCLTNDRRMNGAGLILQEDVRKQIGEFMEGDYFILPSSIHEILILPDNGMYDAAALKAMVQEVNATQVAPGEVLSDKVQFCDGKTAVMENAQKREQRLEQAKEAAEKTAAKGSIRAKLDQAKAEVRLSENDHKTQHKAKEAAMAL